MGHRSTMARSKGPTSLRRAIVTGAASGLGKAVAEALRDQGVSVIGADLRTTRIEGDVVADLTQPSGMQKVVDATESWGAVIHVAGLAADADPAAILRVNLVAPIALTKALQKKARPNACVIAIASVAANITDMNDRVLDAAMKLDPDGVAAFVNEHQLDSRDCYRLSKKALVEWCRRGPLAADGIRYNAISPGPINTALWDRAQAASPQVARGLVELVPHVPSPEEIAPAIAAFAGPAFAWVNGTNLPLDGGLAVLLAHRAETEKVNNNDGA